MKKYYITFSHPFGHAWNTEAKNDSHLLEVVRKEIEGLHPLNSSDEGAEEYRKRFRNKLLFAKEIGKDKEYRLIGQL